MKLAIQRRAAAEPPDPLPLPARATPAAAGLDLRAAIREPTVLAPGERRAIPTGFAIELPPDHEGQIRPRSGLALSAGLTVLNAPGTIDADYRGELSVLLINLGADPIRIERGDRIAQLIVAPVVSVTPVEVDALSTTTRGAGGFGHTGR